MTIKPAALSSLSVSPANVIGGVSSTGTVTLNGAAPTGGTVVALASNNDVASVPANVTVQPGSTTATFQITTSPVASYAICVISASLGVTTRNANLNVKAPALLSLTLSPTTVKGGVQSSNGTVTLTGAAPSGGFTITLLSNKPVAAVPTSITIQAGSTIGTFVITTQVVTANTNVTITAACGGG